LIALSTAALAGAGSYAFTALVLAATSFWVFIVAPLLTLARRLGSFKVTPKNGGLRPAPRAVAPALVAVAILATVSAWGLAHNQNSETLNNAAFALFHICILMTGCCPALRRAQGAATTPAPRGQAMELAS
jgi:hypothetical protein